MFLRILCTWFLEPLSQMQASATYSLGWKKHFNYHGLNPTEITQEHSEKHPILLLHGNFHNQSAWLSLAKRFKMSDLGPVYTVNLPHGNLTNKDCDIINAKIEEIKSQYRQHGKDEVQVDLVGHSRGAKIAYYMGVDQAAWQVNGVEIILKGHECKLRKDIRKIIKLGYPTVEWDLQHFGIVINVYDIIGQHDVIVSHQSVLSMDHQMRVDCGHVELLYNPQVHEQIIKWLET